MSELAINGGAPVRSDPYPAWPAPDDEYVDAVVGVVRSGEWGGFPEPGVNAVAFEEAFAAYQGARHGVLMMNGTVTMEVACKALDIGWGDEVIVPALTFAATAYAPMAAGAAVLAGRRAQCIGQNSARACPRRVPGRGVPRRPRLGASLRHSTGSFAFPDRAPESLSRLRAV